MPGTVNGQLSERELEILRLLATGASNKEIALRLSISANTVKVHLRNIFAKVNVSSRTEAALYAVRTGLVPASDAVEVPGKENSSASEGIAPGTRSSLHTTEVVPERKFRTSILPIFGLVFLVILVWLAISRRWPMSLAGAAQPTATVTPRWMDMAAMPTARYSLAVAAYENLIYAIGGQTSKDVLGTVERYDPQKNVWVSLSSKPTRVGEIGAAVIGGLIYVPGGRTGQDSVTDVVEVYDPRIDRWEKRAPMPETLSAYAALAYEGQLYIFGGWNGSKYVSSVYSYDPSRDSWSSHTPMPTARGYAGAVLARGSIYVFGGRNEDGPLAVNEIYVPDRESTGEEVWSEASPLPSPRYGMGFASIADVVFAFGGVEDGKKVSTALEYSPSVDTWQEFEGPFSQPWSYLSIIPLSTHLYLLGGKFSDTVTPTNLRFQAIYTISIPVLK